MSNSSVLVHLVILDDRLARVYAQQQGLQITGTVGVLFIAGQRGHIDFPTALSQLIASGFRLSSAECQRVLSLWTERRSSAQDE